MVGYAVCFIRACVGKKSSLPILIYNTSHFLTLHTVRRYKIEYIHIWREISSWRILKNSCCLNGYIFAYMYIAEAMLLSKYLKLSGELSCNTSTRWQGVCESQMNCTALWSRVRGPQCGLLLCPRPQGRLAFLTDKAGYYLKEEFTPVGTALLCDILSNHLRF